MRKNKNTQWAARAMALAMTGTVMLGGAAAAMTVPVFAAEEGPTDPAPVPAGNSVITQNPTKGSISIYKHTGEAGSEADKPLAGVTFKVYRVMDLTPGTAAGEFASFTVNANFAAALNGVTADELGNYSAADIEAKAAELAAAAANAAADGEVTTGDNGMANFADLPLGYYLVVETNAPAGYIPISPFLISVPSTNEAGTAWTYDVTAQPKNENVPFEKKFEEETEDGVAGVGDYVKFQIDTTIPTYEDRYFEGENKVTFDIHDIMSDGLTLVNEKDHWVDVLVDADGDGTMERIDPGEGTYTLTAANKETGDKEITHENVTDEDFDLIVSFAQEFIRANRGKRVIVNYDGRINDKAVIGSEGNLNDARLTYSNKPGKDSNTTTDWDDEKVYTFAIDLMKFMKNGEGVDTALAGAEFELYSDAALTTKVGEKQTSTAEGKLAFKQLDEGTYYLKEVKAPTGYTLLANPIKIEITAVKNDKKEPTGEVTVKVNGTEITATEGAYITHVTDGSAYMAVENKKGFTLPGTGGMGIVLFITVGVAGIAAVSAVTMRRTRR